MPNFVRGFGYTITTTKQFGCINNFLNNLRYEENFYIINRGYLSHSHLLGWNNDLSARFFTTKPTVGDGKPLTDVDWNIKATNLNGFQKSYAGVQIGTKEANGKITLTSPSAWTYKGGTKIAEVRLWLNLGGTSVTPTVTIGGKAATPAGKVTSYFDKRPCKYYRNHLFIKQCRRGYCKRSHW